MVLVVKNPPANAGDIRDTGSTPGSGRSPGGGSGSSLQCSCLENPVDRGACSLWGRKEWDTTKWLNNSVERCETQLREYRPEHCVIAFKLAKRLALSYSHHIEKKRQSHDSGEVMTVATVTAGSQYKNATHKHVVHLKCYMSSIAKFKKHCSP